MKKFSIIFILFFAIAGKNATSQENTLFDQYLLNPYYINPAVAGSTGASPVLLSNKQQWRKFGEGPRTISVNGHTRLVSGTKRNKFLMYKPGHGVGANLYNNTKGPLKTTAFQLTYAYHIPIKNQIQLGFGVSGSFARFGIDHTILDEFIPNRDGFSQSYDPAIVEEIEKQTIFDADFGTYFYRRDLFYAGISTMQLLRPLKSFTDDSIYDARFSRQLIANGGYKIYSGSKNFIFEPSLYFRKALGAPKEYGNYDFHVNTRFSFATLINAIDEEIVSFTFSYRHEKSFMGMIDFQLLNAYLGYGYEYHFSYLMNYSTGGHYIVLGYNIPRK